MAAELPDRRATEQPRYTEGDFERFRRDLTEQNRVTILAGQVGELRASLDNMPGLVEATARRVFSEQWAQLQSEARRQNEQSVSGRWRTADTVIAAGQMLIAGILLLTGAHLI